MDLGSLAQSVFNGTPKFKLEASYTNILDSVPSTPIPETTYYNMSTAVSESQGISNEQFRINRVKEIYPDYNPQKIISASEAKIPEARKQEYQNWRSSLKTSNGGIMDGTDYDYAGAFLAGEGQAKNGHLTDTYKLPHHTSFNKFSQYSADYGKAAGSWTKNKEGWSFSESKHFKTNIETLYKNTPEKYKKNYYSKV